MTYLIVLMTTSTKQEATNIVKVLLKERLIACANIVESVSSFFWWQNKIEEEKGVLVIMKSQQDFFEKLSKKVQELHSYDVPEILALPITQGLKSYLDWMKKCFELTVK